ncbi:unnamed protein product [Cunninghamella blakesleeana]
MGAETTNSTLFSKLIHSLCLVILSLLLVHSLTYYITAPNDRTRCHGLLNDGYWQGENYTNWQAPGCMIHDYKPVEVASCLNHSRVLYIGDSIMREQFYSMNRLTHSFDIKGPLHVDRKYKSEKYGMTYEFWWDPYINQTRTIDLLQGKDQTGDKPSLLVIGSGVWYARRLDENVYLQEWKKAIDNVFDGVESTDRIADAVLLSPVEIPQFNLLNPVRQKLITLDKITVMNNYLHQRELSLSPKLPFSIVFAWNTIATSTVNITHDGLHYLPPVTLPQAQLALNYRCNQQLPKHYPINTTCCIHYPTPYWYQSIFFIFFLIWIPLGYYFIDSTKTWIRRLYPSEVKTLTSLFIFGFGVLYMYFCDRTHLFGKIHKHYDDVTFTIQMGIILILGIMTMKKKKGDMTEDQGFLNRGQTDEWKGWMQLIILVYHFTGASGTAGIYNAVRALVAAYLFQTGYGHFYFFYKKKDFGIHRILNVMIRLNLLTFVLMYLMNTDYLSYYFTPLVSLWFMVIWCTMYLGHTYNHHTWFLLLKMGLFCCFTTGLIHLPGVLETLFDILAWVANIHWQAEEWRFRLALDAYIVYIGMLFALATIKFNQHKLHESSFYPMMKWITVAISFVGMIWYFWFELAQPNKQTYNAKHPYISWIPILSFIFLRNATLFLRNINSGFFMWIGKCSLETFIGQFHMWLAADTKGLLVVLPSSWLQPSSTTSHPWGWWLNFILSSIVFLYICHYLSQTTGTLTQWLCQWMVHSPHQNEAKEGGNQHGLSSSHKQHEHLVREDDYQAVPLLPTHSSSPSSSSPTKTSHEEEVMDNKLEVDIENNEEDDLLSLEEEMNTWQSSSTPSRWQRWGSMIWYDARFKSILFVFIMTIINHLC